MWFQYIPMCYAYSLSRARLFATPWTAARQAPLPMGFSRQENWSALPCPPPGGLPDPGVKPTSPALAGQLFTTGQPENPRLVPYRTF